MIDPKTTTGIHVYQVAGTLPRAYLVANHITARNPVEALDTILSNKVDPANTVILEGLGGQGLQGNRLDPKQSSVKLTSYAGSRLLLDVSTDGSGFLVINDAFYPGWSARVDGQQVPVYPAVGWVKAVPVENAGRHSVRLTYEPPLYREGRWLTAVSLVSLLL